MIRSPQNLIAAAVVVAVVGYAAWVNWQADEDTTTAAVPAPSPVTEVAEEEVDSTPSVEPTVEASAAPSVTVEEVDPSIEVAVAGVTAWQSGDPAALAETTTVDYQEVAAYIDQDQVPQAPIEQTQTLGAAEQDTTVSVGLADGTWLVVIVRDTEDGLLVADILPAA